MARATPGVHLLLAALLLEAHLLAQCLCLRVHALHHLLAQLRLLLRPQLLCRLDVVAQAAAAGGRAAAAGSR